MTGLKRVREAYSKVRIIVTDDASSSKEHRAFLAWLEQDGVVVIRNPRNSGFACNVNSALEMIDDEDFVLLNSDTEPEGFWLEALQYGCYASSSGIVGAKLLYANRTIQHAGVHRNPGALEWFDHTYRGCSEFHGPACVPGYRLAVTGACFYVANRAFRKLGKLDNEYPMAFEDVDYCIRAWQAGERVFYYPYAHMVHHESLTRGKIQNKRELTSKKYFWSKWHKFFDGRRVAAEGEKNPSEVPARSRAMTPEIVYVLEDTGIAGGHRNVFDQINLLIESGVIVELWSLADHPTWFSLKTKTRKFPNFAALTAELSPLPSVKVATWWNTAQSVWLASVNNGCAAYLVSDIETSYYVNDPYMQAKVLETYKLDFHYFTISKWNQDKLAMLGIRAPIVSCSVDESVFRPLNVPRRGNVIMTPGRRNHLKNFDFTMRAWSTLGNQRPDLWMYGIEPDIADFLDRTRYFYKPEDVYLNRIINESTAFVLTSRHEGFALTILEAMSAGVPVITTDCHGNRDFCVNGENCLMIQDGDYGGLASAILRIMADKSLQVRLRRSGFATAHAFSRENMRRQLLDFFSGFSGLENHGHVPLIGDLKRPSHLVGPISAKYKT
jgi:GT2 family glycosyltransferase/glycosyltransferase involved in cell wall biosynthesis